MPTVISLVFENVLLSCAALNLCGSLFIIISFYILPDIRQSARGLWHLLIKNVAVVPMTASYLMIPLTPSSPFWCGTRFICETISAPVFLVAELCISLEILFAVRSALTSSHISYGVGLIRGIYVLAVVWGMVGVVAGFTIMGPITASFDDSFAPAPCYFKVFADKLAFFYSVALLSMFVSLCVVAYLMYLQHGLRLAKLSEVTSLLLTILLVFIFTWTPPLLVRFSQEFNNKEITDDAGLQFAYLVTVSGSGFLDSLLWIYFRPVRRAFLILWCGASADVSQSEDEGGDSHNSSPSLWERRTGSSFTRNTFTRSTFVSSKGSAHTSSSKKSITEEVVTGFPNITPNPLLDGTGT